MTDKIELLADWLGVDEDECEDNGWAIETPEGEYIVADDAEADKLATQSLYDLFDAVGVFGLSDTVTQYVLDYALDTAWFDSAMDKSNYAYAEDIESESSSDDDMYVNRLHEELVDAGLMDALDDSEDEDEVEEKAHEANGKMQDLADYMNDQYEDGVEYYRDNFGEEDLLKAVKENNLVDEDKVAEWILETDGRGNTLSGYDSEENDISSGYFAYRVG